MDGHPWARAIDAAAPVAAWRPDLLQRHGLALPRAWADVLELARRGHVEVPGAAINCLMNFLGLCATVGEAPFGGSGRVVSPDVGSRALGLLGALHAACGPGSLERNPIQSLDLLAAPANAERAYCLFPYGYSNYSRKGYADHLLRFGDVPSLEPGGPPMTTTLGGTGLAISSRTKHASQAADYARFVASPAIQATLYTQSGGQPAHRTAWLDEDNNRLAFDYFRATLPALDRAYLRPRYPGYLHGFQDLAGFVLHGYLNGRTSARETLTVLDSLYSASSQSA
jgi:multiple sugar transport system substrate-binding protein